MRYLLDVNVLLFSSNQAASEHETAQAFLARCANDSEVLCLAWLTLTSYLRMATHPRVFDSPLSPDHALHNVEQLVSLPHVRTIGEQDDFLKTWRQVTRDVPTRGNLAPDTHLAVVLKQNGVRTLYTRDRDFLKYSFLKVRDPFVRHGND